MREADTFEPEDDPHDQTPIEEDMPDETDLGTPICLDCGNSLVGHYRSGFQGGRRDGIWIYWSCEVCE